jgi:hypothetical protein
MNTTVQVNAEPGAIVVRIPLKVRNRCGHQRKLMVVDEGGSARPVARHEHTTILKALGRAYRWKRMLESGEFSSITDLANAERINHSYIRRILRLTLLSPRITEAILDGKQLMALNLESLLRPFADGWAEQMDQFR